MQERDSGMQGNSSASMPPEHAGQHLYSRRDFIKAVGLLTIALASCTPGSLKTPDVFQTDTPQPTPTLVEPTATATPEPTATATPTETPTQMPEFRVGITPNMEYEDCNQLHENNIKEELTLLVAKEHAWLDAQGVTPEKMTFMSATGTSNIDALPFATMRFIPNNAYFTSCNVMHMENGSNYFILGLALKRAKSTNIAVFHFGVDDQELEAMVSRHNIWPNDQPPPSSREIFTAAKNAHMYGDLPIDPVIFKDTWMNPDANITALWPNSVKLMQEYAARGISWDDFQYVFSRGKDEKEVINQLETMIIPTWYFSSWLADNLRQATP